MINPFDENTSLAITSSIDRNSYKKNTFEYIGLDISVLKQGKYKLQITVSDLNSGHTVNRYVKFNVAD